MGIVVRQSFLNLISIGIAFLIGAVNTLYLYPTFLGSKFQGLVIALLAISNLIQPFISFGTQHAVIRYYSKYTRKNDKDGLLTLSILIPLVIKLLLLLFPLLSPALMFSVMRGSASKDTKLLSLKGLCRLIISV